MSGSQPLVSVIIPVYNAEKYLRTAVDSVLRQTFTDWELILVDDGSTDTSGEICDMYAQADRRIQTIHQENSGLSRARNTGMAHARGIWLFFIDSDDWIEDYALERLMAHSQDTDVVMGHYPEKAAPWRNVDTPRTFTPAEATPEELSDMFFYKMFHPVWNKLYRRELITGVFEDGLHYIEDVTFNLQQWPNWRRVTIIPDATYHYTIRTDSLSYKLQLDRMRQVSRSFRALREMLGHCENVLHTLSCWYMEELQQYLTSINSIQTLSQDQRELLMNLCVAECAEDGRLLSSQMNSTWHGRAKELLLAQDVQSLLRLWLRPHVSIVIPVYNTENYLPRVLDSVLAQTVSDWELILVDDGSTDGSGAICDRYAAKDSRIHSLHTANNGSSAARNIGMEQARGEWLLFIDSDDRVVPDALERLLAHTEEADVVVGHYPGQKAPWRKVVTPKVFQTDSLSPEDMEELFFLRMFHSPVNKLYRRQSIVVPFRTDVSYIDDVTFLIANFPHWQRVIVLPDDTYQVEERTNSLMHTWRVDRMKQVRESICLFRELFPDESLVMEYLSRWYVIELRMYLHYYVASDLPETVKHTIISLWLDDEGFDYSRISTVLLNEELRVFWDAVLRQDTSALLKILMEI